MTLNYIELKKRVTVCISPDEEVNQLRLRAGKLMDNWLLFPKACPLVAVNKKRNDQC